MPDLTLWKNHQIQQMKQEIDEMFCELYRQFGAPDAVIRHELFLPEIVETEKELTVVFDLTGIDPDNIEILADENSIRLQASAKEQVRKHGRQLNGSKHFSGTLQLPCRIVPEKATAQLEGSTLRIVMPKGRPRSMQKIPIRHI